MNICFSVAVVVVVVVYKMLQKFEWLTILVNFSLFTSSSDNYVNEGGADPTLRHGPNKANVSGPSGMSIKNSSLASGPQASLRSGPQGGLAKGSLYQQGDRQN